MKILKSLIKNLTEGQWALFIQWLMALFNLLIALGIWVLTEDQLASVNTFLLLTGGLILRVQSYSKKTYKEHIWLAAERGFKEGQLSEK